MQIIGEDSKWKSDFGNLYNTDNDIDIVNNDVRYNNNNNNNAATDPVPLFDDSISVFEVKKVIDDANGGKACHIDGISIEVLKTIYPCYFYIHYSMLASGELPSFWGKCIILT